MCGRYNLTLPVEALIELFEFSERPNLMPRYNIAPTQEIPVVRPKPEGGRQLTLMRWGLVPSWSKEVAKSAPMINARSETVATKPSFRTAFRDRRCLVPATGYYEWRTDPSGKQPFHITSAAGGVLAFAGIWETWRNPAEPEAPLLLSCALMTTTPTAELSAIHDRMPVILPRFQWDVWLDPATAPEDLTALLKPYTAEKLSAYPISSRVNAVRNEDADIIKPLADPAPRLI
ncbi:MAG: SOS response-associated peptidase [Alphaproteobacteria bacterium]|nr:SOS response-associated peptidase [Alphaproteobacteria bacterium]